MGLWSKIFGGQERQRRARAAAVAAEVRAVLARGELDDALERTRVALLDAPADATLFAVSAEVLVARGERDASELFSRAASAPDDAQRLFELGSALLSLDASDVARAVLGEAMLRAPLDAVIRSELALAELRTGDPARARATLALHPVLADDPGALVTFGWASLLVGDLDAAREAHAQMDGRAVIATFADKLACALARAEIDPTPAPPDARDFLFLEHGSLLLDRAPNAGGRYAAVTIDERRASLLVTKAADALRELYARPPDVVAVDEGAQEIARALADRLGTPLAPLRPGGRLPACVLVARTADDVGPLAARIEAAGTDVLVLALVLDWSRSVPRVPEIVGLLARDATFALGAEPARASIPPPGDLAAYVRARKALLAPRGRRVRTAYVPDAPLPWP